MHFALLCFTLLGKISVKSIKLKSKTKFVFICILSA